MTPRSHGNSKALPSADLERIVLTLEQELDVPPNQRISLHTVLNAERAFQILESQWRTNPATLQTYVSRLKDLRSNLTKARELVVKELVDALGAVRQSLERLRRQESTLRDALLAHVRASGQSRLEGKFATASVAIRESRKLPSPGSAERRDLEAILHSSGAWESVSVVSAKKLAEFFKNSSVDPQLTSSLRGLCPEQRIFTIYARPQAVRPTTDRSIDELAGFQTRSGRDWHDVEYLMERLGAIDPEVREEVENAVLKMVDSYALDAIQAAEADESDPARPSVSNWAAIDALYREYGGDRDAWGKTVDFIE